MKFDVGIHIRRYEIRSREWIEAEIIGLQNEFYELRYYDGSRDHHEIEWIDRMYNIHPITTWNNEIKDLLKE